MQLVAIDWETFYCTKQKYSLKNMTTEEYIRDPRFQAIMVCIAPFIDGDFRPRKFIGADIDKGLSTIDWENALVVAWNNHFDAAILSWRYGYRIKAPICAMSMFRMMGLSTLAGGESLDKATQWAIKEGYSDRIVPKGHEVLKADGKRLANFSRPELESYAQYCHDDTINAGRLFQILMERGFAPSELPAMAEIIRCFTEPSLRLNHSLAVEVNAEQTAKQRAALDKAGVLVDDLRSDAKFANLLLSLGVEPQKKISKKTGKPAWAFAKSDDFMDELRYGDDEVVADLVEARIANKTTIVASRTQRLVDMSQRGAMPVMLKPAGAHTLRLSGGDNNNPQNYQKKGRMREIVVAGDGYKLIACDKSQIELRLNAYVAGEHTLLEGFRNGRDTYSDYGNNSGMWPYEISKKTVDERFLCKGIVLGAGFGAGARSLETQIKTLARNLGMKVDTSEFDYVAANKAFRRLYKRIVDNWYRTGDQLEAMIAGQETQRGAEGLVHFVPGKGFRFPNGMHIWYHDLHWEQNEEIDPETGEARMRDEMWFMRSKWGRRLPGYIYPAKAVENYIQGLSALNVREDWTEITRRAKKEIGVKWGAIKLQVHDELIARVKAEAAQDYMALMKEVMSTPPWWAPGIPLDCEAAIGDTYAEV